MAEEARKEFGMEKFDGTNFGFQRMQIKDYFYVKKLQLPLVEEKPATMKDKE